jgi:hypothetical protein
VCLNDPAAFIYKACCVFELILAAATRLRGVTINKTTTHISTILTIYNLIKFANPTVMLTKVKHFMEHHAMKAYGGVEVELQAFLDLGTRWR